MTGIEWDVYDINNLEKCQRKLEKILENPQMYATVVLDPLTFFAQSLVFYSLSLRKTMDTKDRRDFLKAGFIDIPERQEYMAEHQALSFFLEAMKMGKDEYGNWNGMGFPGNFIMIAHTVRTTEKVRDGSREYEREKKVLWTAGRKPAAMIPGYFPEIWHFRQETQLVEGVSVPQFLVYTVPVADDFASTQLPLPAVIDFTYPLSLYNQVQKYLTESKASGTV